MLNALKAETLRLLSLRSTLIYAILLTGSLYGPVVILVFGNSKGKFPVDLYDFNYFFVIFTIVAIAFAGAASATEIRYGSTSISFMTQRKRWYSYYARAIAVCVFLIINFLVGIGIALIIPNLFGYGITGAENTTGYFSMQLGFVGVWAIITVGIAYLSKSTVLSVTLPLAWLLIVENLAALIPIKMVQELMDVAPLHAFGHLLKSFYPDGTEQMFPMTHSATTYFIALMAVPVFFAAWGLLNHTRKDAPA